MLNYVVFSMVAVWLVGLVVGVMLAVGGLL